MLKSLDSECKSCAPITPIECITNCRVYKLKNELRCLRKTLDAPDYIKDLFNALKNETRLTILQTFVKGRYSPSQLQLELKNSGQNHSLKVISEEYLRPLETLGLVNKSVDQYQLTLFGGRLTKLLGCFPDFALKLPAHSECYEEAVIQHLLTGPKTFEGIEAVIPLRNVSRTLKRLRSAQLIKTPTEREYVFFFKTIRASDKETLTITQRKIYDAITTEGIPAGKLACQTRFSLRVTYECLKHLRGKKLAFQRRTPKTYDLTLKGKKLATDLHELQQTVEDAWFSFQQISQDNALTLKVESLTDSTFMR